MRTILFGFLIVGLVMNSGSYACTSVASRSTVSSTIGAMKAIGPRSLDFKKQEVPKKIPSIVKRDTVPNLQPLIEQLMRHSELERTSNNIMPWVYLTGTELIVADYEDAVARLELADECLQEAMQNVLIKSNDSLETDPALNEAKLLIDAAEYPILFLREMAVSEL